MLAGGLKALPLSLLLGTLSVQDIALYATTVTLLAGLLVIGAVWAAAKAWRERAEARTDEAKQLGHELGLAELDRRAQAERITRLEAELGSRPDIRESLGVIAKGHEELLTELRRIGEVLTTTGRD